MRKEINGFVGALLVCVLAFTGCSLFDVNGKTGDYSISGKITDKDGKAISGVDLWITGSPGITAETDSSGNYTLKNLSKGTLEISAKKTGYLFVPAFENAGTYVTGSYINVGSVAENGVVNGANFVAIRSDLLKISDVQGEGARSPLEGKTVTVTGVVTMVTNKAPNFKYDNSDLMGETIAQYVGTDGFFLEALPEDKDLSGKKSNGIYISTHDESYVSSKWIDGIPTDLKAGDVVTVTGLVEEQRVLDRYGSSSNTLTKTVIIPTVCNYVMEGSSKKQSAYPDGVLLTYNDEAGLEWILGHEADGKREYRKLVADSDSKLALQEAIDVLETVESMVIRINDPYVSGATYYNLTSILPDGGYKDYARTQRMRTLSEKWQGNVIRENPVSGYQDYNEETIYVDYQAVDWATYYPLAQIGDYIVDSTGARVFRGVMDYIADGKYMAHPLNTEAAQYIQNSSRGNYLTPYYTLPGSSNQNATLTSVTGQTIPNQKWSFDVSEAWYNVLGSSYVTAINSNGKGETKSNSGNILSYTGPVKTIKNGTASASSFDANDLFTPAWKSTSSVSKGNLEASTLTVSSFNFENYTAQGSEKNKQEQLAVIIKNNLLYPDVLCVVEMGDDKATGSLYNNMDNAYVIKDGVVTAVRNFSGISDTIVSNGGPRYDFRCIDPKDGDSGGKAGVNIRVGLMYNTERVVAVDSGLPTNTYANTHDEHNSILAEEKWPVQTADGNTQGWTLNETVTTVYAGSDGKAHLSQSPCYYDVEEFQGSRRPLVCEFKMKDDAGNVTDENFFVIVCHLSSKRADTSSYGSVQPPLLLSETGRSKQSQAVNDLVQEILSCDPDARIIVAGDMNDFAYSTPQKILTGEKSGNQILFSLTEAFMPETERFSYYFEGNLQQIDHIFVSRSLYEKAEAAVSANALGSAAGEEWNNVCFIPHINSMVTRNNNANFSDHDPDMIRIPGAF